MVVDGVEMVTDGITVFVTWITIELDVALVLVTHISLLVKVHVTALLFAIVVVAYVAEFAPTFTPFTFH